MKASEMVIDLEREVGFLRAENQQLKNYICEHGLTIGLVPRKITATRVTPVPDVESGMFDK